jgi:hypothetical protein
LIGRLGELMTRDGAVGGFSNKAENFGDETTKQVDKIGLDYSSLILLKRKVPRPAPVPSPCE